MKGQDAVSYKRHNKVYPFEDETSIEFFAQKNDTALFAYGSHSKKRPDNLILGSVLLSEVALRLLRPSAQGGCSTTTFST